MKLGNAVFGNSRGEFPVPRIVGWEDELMRLFRVCTPNNREVSYTLYWWGNCTYAYMNQNITLDEFREIIDACIRSVKEAKNE